jgi:glycogen debranching enzyme
VTLSISELEQLARTDLARLRTPDGWLEAGIPRFARLFGRDSCISALQLLPEDPEIAAATIRALAARQGTVTDDRREEEPGKIPHEVPVRREDRIRLEIRKHFRWGFPYYGSIDSTSWWIRLVDHYVAATGDDALLGEVRPNLERAAAWMAGPARIGIDGLVAYRRRNPAALLHQGWRDSGLSEVSIPPPVAVVEAQGYHAEAAMALGRLGVPAASRADLAPDPDLVHARFWMADEGIHALAVGGDGEQAAMVTSNAGHLLGTPILSDERAALVADRLFVDDLWTPAGIRTHSSRDPWFDPDSYHLGSVWPHDNWVIHEGLRAIGRHDDAARVRRAVLDALRELEQIPELYAVHDGRPRRLAISQTVQAWASGAVVSFLAAERAA